MRIAIIGAGLAGLTAAQELRRHGLSPIVFDKSRGPGGRMSTRRAEGGLRFDHGAQYLSPKTAGFASFLRGAESAGAAARWDIGDGRARIVGVPGMSAIARHLAQGVVLQSNVEVVEISRDRGGWRVAGDFFDRVICTVPAPQAVRLLSAAPTLADDLHEVVMEPVLALMLAHPAGADTGFTTRRRPGEDIAWLALDSAKPGRSGHACWVAHAGPGWSRDNLERDKADLAARLLPLVCDLVGIGPDEVTFAAGHRWRYAHASTPLGKPFLAHDDTLFVGGDWALSARAEGAWQSGRAMAEALLQTQ